MRKALQAFGLSKINSGYELANNKGEIINKFIKMVCAGALS
jgi:ribosomal protein L30/L7E